jgi:TIR domain
MKVFISYAHTDKVFVERLARDLRKEATIDAWLDRWEIILGDRIIDKLEEALSNASVFVSVLSPDGVNSSWCQDERSTWLTLQNDKQKFASQQSLTPNRRLIPVLYRDCEIPPLLRSFLHVSINEQNYKDGFRQLVQGIKRESDQPPLENQQVTNSDTPTSLCNTMAEDMPEKIALDLLKVLLASQFKQVIFYYGVDEAELSQNWTQAQTAIEVINFAIQREGKSLSDLLNTIYKVAPHLRR